MCASKRDQSCSTDFSRADVAILVIGAMGGTGLLSRIGRIDDGAAPTAGPFGGHITLAEVLLMGIIVGTACAGPVVLLVQWGRGRTLRLRLGEWLWLIPLPLYLVTLAGSRLILDDVGDLIHLLWFAWWVSVQGVVSLAALAAMFRHDLLWTDRVGCVSCFLVGAMVFVNLVLHPLAV